VLQLGVMAAGGPAESAQRVNGAYRSGSAARSLPDECQ